MNKKFVITISLSLFLFMILLGVSVYLLLLFRIQRGEADIYQKLHEQRHEIEYLKSVRP